jgi:hypothetical protein
MNFAGKKMHETKPLDKYYLLIQFQNQILLKYGTEFQEFFEKIFKKVYPNFRPIKPYQGDGGNDGYIKDAGIYYQVYAPKVPKINERKAAKKLQDDFHKLEKEWNDISSINEYVFVYNDKYDGSIQLLEAAVTKLNSTNPTIDFKLYLASDLEQDFFLLNEFDFIELGFNTNRRLAVRNAYDYFNRVETELDRENAKFAQKILEINRNIVIEIDDEDLLLEYEILESRCLRKIENIDEAKTNYESIATRFPNDSRALLYLAEIYLVDKDFIKNNEFLIKAKKNDPDFWLYKLEELARKIYRNEAIDIANIDESLFSKNPKIRSSFYRLYSAAYERSNDPSNADRFIEIAIKLNPDRFNNYVLKLWFIENRMIQNQDYSQRIQMSQELIGKIEELEEKFIIYGDIGARNKINLNNKKLHAFLIQDNLNDYIQVAQETIELVLTCYLNKEIEQSISDIFQVVFLPDDELTRVLEYIKSSIKVISEPLCNSIITQFYEKERLLTDGKEFFEAINSQRHLNFINDLENGNFENALKFVLQDIGFAIKIATLKCFPEFRKMIVENIPDEGEIQKDKLLLLLNYQENNFDEAFEILQQLDLSSLNYVECLPMLHIAQLKEAWDFEIIILKKLLKKERNVTNIFRQKMDLFNAYLNSKNYIEMVDMGEHLLEEDSKNKFLDANVKLGLLSNTILACIERGKVDSESFIKAKELFKKHPIANPSFEFKVGIEAALYLNTREVEKALNSVIDGVKIKKVLSSQEYAKLYPLLSLEIGNQIDIDLKSLDSVQHDTFVKLETKDQWYFVGIDNELDAIRIAETNEDAPARTAV